MGKFAFRNFWRGLVKQREHRRAGVDGQTVGLILAGVPGRDIWQSVHGIPHPPTGGRGLPAAPISLAPPWGVCQVGSYCVKSLFDNGFVIPQPVVADT